MDAHLTATVCHFNSLANGFTQCYLPPYTSEHSALTPARQAGDTRFTYPGGMELEG